MERSTIFTTGLTQTRNSSLPQAVSTSESDEEVTACFARYRGIQQTAHAFEVRGLEGGYIPYIAYHEIGVHVCQSPDMLEYVLTHDKHHLTIEGEGLGIIKDSILTHKLLWIQPGEWIKADDSSVFCRIRRITFMRLDEPAV